jgi:hypothetical protein
VITGAIVPQWTRVFHQQIPKELELVGKKVDQAFSNFIADFLASVDETCPELSGSSHRLKGSFVRLGVEMRDRLRMAFKALGDASKEVHRLINPTVNKYMLPLYASCGGESGTSLFFSTVLLTLACSSLSFGSMLTVLCRTLGKGYFARVKSYMYSNIIKISDNMYNDAKKVMIHRIGEDIVTLGTNIDAAIISILQLVRQDFDIMLDKNCIVEGDSLAGEKPDKIYRNSIAAEIRAGFVPMDQAWIDAKNVGEDVPIDIFRVVDEETDETISSSDSDAEDDGDNDSECSGENGEADSNSDSENCGGKDSDDDWGEI